MVKWSGDSSRPPTSIRFTRIQRTAAADSTVEMIKSMIVSGELQAGQALPSERELAVQLGVSRPTLREAVRALTTMNILESRHGAGTYVSSLEPELLAEPLKFVLRVNDSTILALFEVRRVLESYASSVAAERASVDELGEIDLLAAQAARVIDQPERFLELDQKIHAAIIRAARNPILTSLAASVSHLALESRKITAQLPGTRTQAHKDHLEIISALRARDSEAARNAMLRHLAAIEHAFRVRMSPKSSSLGEE